VSNYNPNLVKINRNYTFEELAAVFSVHKNTVATWVKNGLFCLKDKRPFLIMGDDARNYLQNQRKIKKQSCNPNEMFCMRCKKPTIPDENFVEYLSISLTKGRLTGFCSFCECLINKFVSFESLSVYSEIFDLAVSKELEHIKECNNIWPMLMP